MFFAHVLFPLVVVLNIIFVIALIAFGGGGIDKQDIYHASLLNKLNKK